MVSRQKAAVCNSGTLIAAAMETLTENKLLASEKPREETRLAWLALAMSPGLGPKRIADAMRQVEAPIDILSLPLTAQEGLRLPAEAAQFIFDGKARAAAETELKRVTAEDAVIVSFDCPEYPERLKEIFDPPPVVWVRGDARQLSRPSIAVVGTRHPSPYRSGVTEMLSRELAARKLLIVSGTARGIDTCAHKGALAARMPTVAVWGTGIDVVYPKENRQLAEEILALGGAIVSEVPMGVSSAAEFPTPQPDHQRPEHWGSGGGGKRELGHARNGAVRGRAGSGSLRGAGQRDQQAIVDAEHPYQAGRKAGGDVGGHLGRFAVAGPPGIGECWGTRIRIRRGSILIARPSFATAGSDGPWGIAAGRQPADRRDC